MSHQSNSNALMDLSPHENGQGMFALIRGAWCSGVLDPGCGMADKPDPVPNFYATNTILEPAGVNYPGGRTLLVGWIRGFPAGGGWNGCLSLPRVLTLSQDGVPSQQPIAGNFSCAIRLRL